MMTIQPLLSIALFGIPVGVVFDLYHGSDHEEVADMSVVVYAVVVPKRILVVGLGDCVGNCLPRVLEA